MPTIFEASSSTPGSAHGPSTSALAAPLGFSSATAESLRAPSDGSRTMTIAPPLARDTDGEIGTLTVRARVTEDSEEGDLQHPKPQTKGKKKQKVVWDEDVIDNEGCGKKKSKSASLPVVWVLD